MTSAGLRPTAYTLTRTCYQDYKHARCAHDAGVVDGCTLTSPGAGDGTGHAVSSRKDSTGPSASITHAVHRRDSPTNQCFTAGLEGDGAAAATSATDAFNLLMFAVVAGDPGDMGALYGTAGSGWATRTLPFGVFCGDRGDAGVAPRRMDFGVAASGEGALTGARVALGVCMAQRTGNLPNWPHKFWGCRPHAQRRVPPPNPPPGGCRAPSAARTRQKQTKQQQQ